MPLLERDEGVKIHWEAEGDGPSVILGAYWSGHPGVYSALIEDLVSDHRVVTYDARGTGGSTRLGPYDMETDAADLAALIEHSGSPAVVIATADGCNRAVRVAAAHPTHVLAVITMGTPPLSISAMQGRDALIGSETVVGAFLDMVERDYRGAMRALLTATNEQMSDDELRDRVAFQVDYCPRDAAIGRLRDWSEDDPFDAARALGSRLVVVTSQNVAGAWLPTFDEMRETVAELLPDARLEEVTDGAVSRPEETAAVVRGITGTGPPTSGQGIAPK